MELWALDEQEMPPLLPHRVARQAQVMAAGALGLMRQQRWPWSRDWRGLSVPESLHLACLSPQTAIPARRQGLIYRIGG